MKNDNLIKTEIEGIYRDPNTKALIIKKDPIYRDLIKVIKELDRRIRKLEEIINNNYGEHKTN